MLTYREFKPNCSCNKQMLTRDRKTSDMNFRPRCMATTLSVLPHREPLKACEVILAYFPEAPCVPRLTMSLRMFLEGMPCVVIDAARRQLSLDLSREQELLHFYESCEASEVDHFAISPESAPVLYTFADVLARSAPAQLQLIHVDLPGPLTMGLSMMGRHPIPAWYDETMRDIIVKTLIMKIRWLERFFKETFPDKLTMITLAEPSLATYSTPFGSLSREDMLKSIDEVLNAIQGLRAVHCCANIDWSILTESSTQVINFDAFRFSESVALYTENLKNFMERGGMLAWGLVPVDDTVRGEDVESLMSRLDASIKLMVNEGIDKQLLLEFSFITPSCTTSLLSVDMAEKVFQLTNEVSRKMREKYF
jgi:hypothetical protein